jgi:hypothetical protein
LTLPIVHCIQRFPSILVPKDASFPRPAQWIVSPRRALFGEPQAREFSMPELAISADKVGFLIEKMREFDVKGADSDPDSGSNGADDNMIDVLEDNGDDAVVREITGFINAMTEDEQIDLVALMRLGRGDGTIEDWAELRREAADGHDGRTAGYLLGEPLVSDYLAEGLDGFGLSWTDERITPVR